MIIPYLSSKADAPVLVIGSAGIDVVGRLENDLHMDTSNPSRISSSFGGVARNVAENLARLGQDVTFISAVGTDLAGDQLVEQLSNAGVDVGSVVRNKESPTGTYLAVVNPNGKLHVALDDMRAIAALTPEYLQSNRDLFKQASLVFLDANLSPEALRTAIALARRSRIPICADPTSTSLAGRLRPYLSKLFLITPNNIEAGILCDRNVEADKRRQARDAVKCLVSKGVKIAIITLAQFGVYYASSETSGYLPSIRTDIVDPTGAGDALSAAVIFALLNDIPLDDAIRLGVSAASLTLRHRGSVLPDLSLEKLYDQLVF